MKYTSDMIAIFVNFVKQYLFEKYPDEKFIIPVWEQTECLAAFGTKGSRFQFYFIDLVQGKILEKGMIAEVLSKTGDAPEYLQPVNTCNCDKCKCAE
jgi:hypothetical protein